jgi:hypothetical protein
MRRASAERAASVRNSWSEMSPQDREERRQAIRAGIARRFDPVTPEGQAYRARLARRRWLRNLVEQDAGDRCRVCGLLQPHECLDQVEVRQP